MNTKLTYLSGCFILIFGAAPLRAQQIKVMHWNIEKGLGDSVDNQSAPAQAIARIVNYNQPDILLFNELESHSVQSNIDSLVDWVTNNVSYLGTQPGVTFYVAVSSVTDGFNRNAAISRYPISNAITYDPGLNLRGLHSFKVQLTGTNVLQVFHAHLKCCADDCPRKQTEAQYDADRISEWASTNSAPYIFAGDWNEDEENQPPVCTLSDTYHPISTIRTNGGLVEFKPTTLSGEYRTWSTRAAVSIRFDYVLAATNRLDPASGYVFSSADWASHGLYTNSTNLATDSATAADHYCVFVNYSFPTIAPNFTVTPASAFTSTGNPGGPFSPSSQVYTLNNTNTTSLSWGVGKSAAWLTLSATSGTLGAGASTNITASINSAANTLAGGAYADTITFSNATTGASVGRSVSLAVLAPPRLVVSPSGTLTSIGPSGGPFNPPSFTYTLSNAGSSSALNWSASASTNWLSLSTASGTLAPGASTNVVASLNSAANSLPNGNYTNTLTFANTTNGNGNTNRVAVLNVGAVDYFTELFSASDNDLDNQMFTFTPDGSASFYSVCRNTTNALPTNPSGGTTLSLTDDSFSQITLTGGTNVALYGTVYTSFFVGSNGCITFGSGDATYSETLSDHFNRPRISALFDDLLPSSNISWRQLADRVAVTWLNIREFDANNQNTFQIELFFDGRIRITYLAIAATDGLAGLSRGTGVPTGFVESNLSGYGSCAPVLAVTPPTVLNVAGEQGGPFAPSQQTYALSNTGGSALNWSASVSNNWLSLSAVSGVLGAGANTNVMVSTNGNANALVGGLYSNLVSFVNSTNGAGNTNRVATLLVRDGIADAWRQQYFGHVEPNAGDRSRAQDDPDGDGLNNLAEYVFGSVPTNAGSVFQLQITPSGSGVQLSFPSLTGRLYTIEINDALGAGGAWLPVGAFTNVAGTGGVLSYTDSAPPATRAYRLRGRVGP